MNLSIIKAIRKYIMFIVIYLYRYTILYLYDSVIIYTTIMPGCTDNY